MSDFSVFISNFFRFLGEALSDSTFPRSVRALRVVLGRQLPGVADGLVVCRFFAVGVGGIVARILWGCRVLALGEAWP